jgi:hypothetical protein
MGSGCVPSSCDYLEEGGVDAGMDASTDATDASSADADASD